MRHVEFVIPQKLNYKQTNADVDGKNVLVRKSNGDQNIDASVNEVGGDLSQGDELSIQYDFGRVGGVSYKRRTAGPTLLPKSFEESFRVRYAKQDVTSLYTNQERDIDKLEDRFIGEGKTNIGTTEAYKVDELNLTDDDVDRQSIRLASYQGDLYAVMQTSDNSKSRTHVTLFKQDGNNEFQEVRRFSSYPVDFDQFGPDQEEGAPDICVSEGNLVVVFRAARKNRGKNILVIASSDDPSQDWGVNAHDISGTSQIEYTDLRIRCASGSGAVSIVYYGILNVQEDCATGSDTFTREYKDLMTFATYDLGVSIQSGGTKTKAIEDDVDPNQSKIVEDYISLQNYFVPWSPADKNKSVSDFVDFNNNFDLYYDERMASFVIVKMGDSKNFTNPDELEEYGTQFSNINNGYHLMAAKTVDGSFVDWEPCLDWLAWLENPENYEGTNQGHFEDVHVLKGETHNHLLFKRSENNYWEYSTFSFIPSDAFKNPSSSRSWPVKYGNRSHPGYTFVSSDFQMMTELSSGSLDFQTPILHNGEILTVYDRVLYKHRLKTNLGERNTYNNVWSAGISDPSNESVWLTEPSDSEDGNMAESYYDSDAEFPPSTNIYMSGRPPASSGYDYYQIDAGSDPANKIRFRMTLPNDDVTSTVPESEGITFLGYWGENENYIGVRAGMFANTDKYNISFVFDNNQIIGPDYKNLFQVEMGVAYDYMLYNNGGTLWLFYKKSSSNVWKEAGEQISPFELQTSIPEEDRHNLVWQLGAVQWDGLNSNLRNYGLRLHEIQESRFDTEDAGEPVRPDNAYTSSNVDWIEMFDEDFQMDDGTELRLSGGEIKTKGYDVFRYEPSEGVNSPSLIVNNFPDSVFDFSTSIGSSDEIWFTFGRDNIGGCDKATLSNLFGVDKVEIMFGAWNENDRAWDQVLDHVHKDIERNQLTNVDTVNDSIAYDQVFEDGEIVDYPVLFVQSDGTQIQRQVEKNFKDVAVLNEPAPSFFESVYLMNTSLEVDVEERGYSTDVQVRIHLVDESPFGCIGEFQTGRSYEVHQIFDELDQESEPSAELIEGSRGGNFLPSTGYNIRDVWTFGASYVEPKYQSLVNSVLRKLYQTKSSFSILQETSGDTLFSRQVLIAGIVDGASVEPNFERRNTVEFPCGIFPWSPHPKRSL